MKLKSVSGLLCFVSNLDVTVDFYEKLGFKFKERTPDYATGYLNWFWLEFVPVDKAEPSVFQNEVNTDGLHNGAGAYLHISVENVDEYYEGITEKGLTPASDPKNFPWGRREFILRDPDGYKLVFFTKK